ncbi:MAG: MATE family efflux transporter [Acholeplasmataceae bacterium]|jgi:putative MATE family efflux protein|nr:MATE family efflux transporter [Acholeplasmataceae bacterium]
MKRSFQAIFWPTLIELLFFMLMGTIDTFMLSNYSDYAVGSVGNSNTIIQMFAVLLLVVANGVAVLVSQYLGAKKEHVSKRVIANGMMLNILVGGILTTLLVALASTWLHLVKTEEVLFEGSLSYLRVVGISLFFVAISNVVTASLRSYGHAKYITYVVVVANILNIIGNAILINGYLGFPRLGILGAGISTLIVRILMMLVYLFLLYKIIGIRFKDFKFNLDTSKQVFKIGLPSALESWTYTLMQGIILSMINQLGADFTTTRTYINTILTYIYVFSLAFAAANAVMTGYYIGERDFKKAHLETIKTALRSFIVVLTMTLIVNLFSPYILGMFTRNELIIKTARSALWIAIVLEFSRSLNLIFIQALRSAGDTTFPLVMAVLSMMGVAVTLAYILGIHLGLGLLGIYIAYASDELIRGLMMYLRWQSRKWEGKSKYIEHTI